MNIETALKSKSYIIDLDRVKFSLGFFSDLFNGEFFHQLSGSTFFCCQKHTPKSRKSNIWPRDSCMVL